ncbi:MAG: hypothetical protein GY929_17300 [Actinomycetia bacterium]|nr:hypothetical protein [Actinomycetes bacterium]
MARISPLRSRPVPPWAAGLSRPDYDQLLDLITADLGSRDLTGTYRDDRISLDDGRELGLVSLTNHCVDEARSTWPEVVRIWLDTLLDSDSHESRDLLARFDDVQPLLKARLLPCGVGDPSALVSRSVAPGLEVTLMVDLPEVVRSVAPSDALPWGVPEGELFRIALANVRAQDPPIIQELPGENGVALTALTGSSFFTATHALWADQFVDADRENGLLAAIPNRHTVLLHPVRDRSVVDAVHTMTVAADQVHGSGLGAISPTLWWIRPDRAGEAAQSWTELPCRIGDEHVEFAPPEPFVDLLNRLPHA